MAGAASVDITPAVGVLLDGYGARTTPSEGVHDPLFARALVVDYGPEGAATIVGCDLLGMHPWTTAEVRRQVEAAHGIPADGVIVLATHNHAGPAGLRRGCSRGWTRASRRWWLGRSSVRSAGRGKRVG